MEQTSLMRFVIAGVLVLLRCSSALMTMPVFSSPAIPARVKALLVLTLVIVLTPFAASIPGVTLQLSANALFGEVAVGLGFGLTLALLQEAVLLSASLMGGAFSFSLANLVDPNSLVETEVLGTALGWMMLLVLLAADVHRTMLAALLRTLCTIPLGHAIDMGRSGGTIAYMASGIFLSGLQLASPVLAAALMVEVAIGLISRLAPAMPAQIASVPVKTIVSYTILTGGLALWPGWIERHFNVLLDAAQRQVRL